MTETQGSADDLALAEELARAAGKLALEYFRRSAPIENKAGGDAFDPVTEADRAAERLIRGQLSDVRPTDGVLGEEFAETPGSSGRRWVIDPIDGTRSFIAGLPLWGTLVALEAEGQPRFGAMYQPYLDELYSGDGRAAHLNTKAISTSNATELAAARLATTDLDLFGQQERAAFLRVKERAQLCRFGTDCYAYARLAAGDFELVIESGLKPFDIQALIPIITGAGGIVSNWRGGPAHRGGQILAAANADIHGAAMALLRGA